MRPAETLRANIATIAAGLWRNLRWPRLAPAHFVVALLLLVAVVGGAAIAVLGPTGAVLLSAVSVMAAAVALANVSGNRYRDWIFATALLILLLLPLLQRALGGYYWGVWQVFVFAGALLGVPQFFQFAARNRGFAIAVALLALFLLLGLASSVYGRSQPKAFLYQLVSNLKPMLVVALGFALVWSVRTESLFWRIVRWLWLPALLMVAFEWIAPDLYFTLLPGKGMSGDPTGLFPSRALGTFEHPSFLATTSALFALAAFVRSLSPGEPMGRYMVIGSLYFLLLICSVQRQEFVACVLAVGLALGLMRPQKLLAVLMAGALPVIALSAAFTLFYWDNITAEAAQWGLGSYGPIQHPRAQIFAAASNLARQYFPLGTGLGTFGGAGAEKFDQSLYLDLGFASYWWFGEQDFLMDTYWPNSLSEAGVFGMLLLLASYAALLLAGIGQALTKGGRAKVYWAMFAGGMLYTLLLSLSSPAFQDPRLFILAALWAGVAVRCRQLDGARAAGFDMKTQRI